MGTLREEFRCAVSGRFVNIGVNALPAAQRSFFAREDEIGVSDGIDTAENELGMRSFIPSSMTDTDQYWDRVAERCFEVSAQMSTRMFFLTLTMNKHWPDYQA
jgi:hypothetical protein